MAAFVSLSDSAHKQQFAMNRGRLQTTCIKLTSSLHKTTYAQLSSAKTLRRPELSPRRWSCLALLKRLPSCVETTVLHSLTNRFGPAGSSSFEWSC